MRRSRAGLAPTAALAIATLLAGCAVPDQSRPDIISQSQVASRPSAVSRPATPASIQMQVYFVNSSNQVTAVSRSNHVADLATAISALLAGPTNQEIGAGISSAIPPGTTLHSFHQSGSTADLDFSDALASVSGHEQLLAFAQIVLTADSLVDVGRVQISIAGQVVNPPEPNGTLAQGPVSRNDYLSLIAP